MQQAETKHSGVPILRKTTNEGEKNEQKKQELQEVGTGFGFREVTLAKRILATADVRT